MNSQDDQERERVVGEHHEVHAGEEGRIERQHALRRLLVTAIAEREQARRGGAEIDHREEEGRERVEPEMRADPRQAERQRHVAGGAAPSNATRPAREPDERHGEAGAVDELLCERRAGRARPPRSAAASRIATHHNATTIIMSCLQPDAAPALGAGAALADQHDAGRLERADELHQQVDVAADHVLRWLPCAGSSAATGRRVRPACAGRARAARARRAAEQL